MAEQEIPTVAFILSLLGGLLILLSGIVFLMIGAAFMGSMMGALVPGLTGLVSSVIAGLGVWGLICGVIILLGAYMIYTRPDTHGMWGIIILVFSLLSFIEGGGYIIGAILGIVGGILAITWKPEKASAEAEKPA
jgi:hypothetical protein